MEGTKSSKAKAVSLNDRHYRLLQDFSAQPKPSSNPSVKRDVGGEQEEEEKPLIVSLQSQPRLPTSLTVNGYEKEKPMKVKINGRRRLCKLKSREDGNVDDQVEFDEPCFSKITDFESPPPQNESEDDNSGGANEIRDILSDLSSRLEFLSIEKKRVSPRKFDAHDISSGPVKCQAIKEERRVDLTDYESYCPSFSIMSDPSDFLVDANTCAGGAVKNVISECEENKHGEVKKKCVHEILGKKSIALGKTLIVKDEEGEDDDDNDCVFLSTKRMVNGANRQGGKHREENKECDGMDALGDFSNDFVLESKSSITLSGPKNFKLPSKIEKMLFPHQRDGLRWLWSLHCQGKGGILGDDMGLGKTMQICGFLAGLFHSRLIKRVLVVSPKTLLPHWIKELSAVGLSEITREYFAPSAKLRLYELQYVLQDKGVLLTTYDIVRNNSKSLVGNSHCVNDDEENEDGITWDYMILDEGHLIKNPSTQRAKSLLEIPSAHRIIISGTPLQNNLKELWALFSFCCPDLLGDKKRFRETYENPILRGNDKKASERDKRIGSSVAKELRERIQPYFLRRMKSEVFSEENDQMTTKLSKKDDIIVWLRMTNCQRRLYEAFLNSEIVLSAFDGSPLAALTILKKICDHPLLLTKRAAEDVLEGMDPMLNPEDAGVAEKLAMYIADVSDKDDYEEKQDNISCKISFILSLLENLIPEGHNVLIFSQTRKMLNLIQESLLSIGYDFLRIDGTTKASDRLKIVNDFQEGRGAPIFLLTSQVGGLGLTLTRADRVIVVDPAWNPSTDNQSVDRAYRIGQNKDVIVYRLMTCGTVEEKIYRKQIFKGGLFKSATEHKEQIRYFSQQDLRELFSLPKEGFDISVTQQQLLEEHDRQHTMDEFLKSHVEFLETKGIAGVSHHNLLFSKTAPVQVFQEEEQFLRNKEATFGGCATSSSSFEDIDDGARYAFHPKDVKLNRVTISPVSTDKLSESKIRERINRMSQTLANKGIISRLPDKGEKIRKQIAVLNSELDELRMGRGSETEVVDLDDITGKFKTVLNV